MDRRCAHRSCNIYLFSEKDPACREGGKTMYRALSTVRVSAGGARLPDRCARSSNSAGVHAESIATSAGKVENLTEL